VTRAEGERGFTLVEVLVAVAIMSSMAMVIYGAFAGMKRSKEGVERINDRFREGRLAVGRIARELQSAYLSAHEPLPPAQPVQKTAFVGSLASPSSRLDFTTFAHRRLDANAKESDQAEVSYFTQPSPEDPDRIDLVRRSSPRIDLEPESGGRLDVLATDVDYFALEYLDPVTGAFVDRWDTRQATEQLGRLPLQVQVTLVLKGGRRVQSDAEPPPIRLVTKIPIPISKPLAFATQGG